MSTLTISLPRQAERRALLEGCWRARLERITELSLAYHDAAQWTGRGTIAERSRAARRVRKLARAAASERQELAEIEAALQRISSGEYGQCEQCRAPISAALLASRPQARYCESCGRLADQPAEGGPRLPATA
jgi:RNA polymerase-binding transcription factor DksA